MFRRDFFPLLVMLGATSFALPVGAAGTLFFENFENGASAGWELYGDTTPAITADRGDHSLLMTGDAGAVHRVDVAGIARVRIAAQFAAADLGNGDACIAEASLDEGRSWFTVIRIIPAQADGVSLHAGSVWRDLPPRTSSIWFRAWLAGEPAEGTCRLDNVSMITAGQVTSSEPRAEPRKLSKSFLVGTESLGSPVAMEEFALPDDSEQAANVFSGLLRLVAPDTVGAFRLVADLSDRVGKIGEPIRHLPEFEFEFVQVDDAILPLRRGVLRSEHPHWEFVLQPGKAWQEPDDGEWTRAALPFALQERSADCTHNGVMTWLFNDRDEISRVAYQIASETCGYFKFDMWGTVDADYEPRDLEDRAQPHFERFAAHRRSRLPVRPIAALAAEFPGVDPSGFGVDDGIHPDDMTIVGLVVDGIHYRSECRTRRGPHPFCASLPLPSYSTAKSIFAGIAVMRLEKLYPGASRRSIGSLIDRCDPRRWRDVTIGNTLDMATGNFRSQAFEEDEFSVPHEWFVFADNNRDKLSFACNFFPRKAQPGTRFVYHTSDTYVLGTALARFVAGQNAGADLYDSVIVQPIWHALELSPLLDETRRTYDAVAQPFTGHGLTYEADDIVRIALWLRNGARLAETTMLDRAMLDAALQRDPADRGLPAGIPGLRYNNGFWGFDAGASLGCAGEVWVPFMSGVSGITVAMFPNGVIYYYFSDSYVFRWQSAREAAHRIAALC